MGFNSTANKKRPMTFSAMLGQDFVVSTIKNSIKNNRISHAYLFSGPRGVGKTTTARLLAKILCCTEPTKDGEPCMKCSSCVSITNGSAIDVIEIDGASNTSVDDVRNIKEELTFPPSLLKYKIYIIDEVHMLSNSAFNALLKTIEEPPQYAIFIFATTELNKVPETIKSRCQTFIFSSLTDDDLYNMIKKAAKDDKITIDDESIKWIVKKADGGARDAYTIFDQCASFCDGKIIYDKIKEKNKLISAEDLQFIFENAVNENTKDALLKFRDIIESGTTAENFVIAFSEYIHDLMLLKNGVFDNKLLNYSTEYFSKEITTQISKNNAVEMLSSWLALYRNIKYCVSKKFEIEVEISKLSSYKNIMNTDEIVKALYELKSSVFSKDEKYNITNDIKENSTTYISNNNTMNNDSFKNINSIINKQTVTQTENSIDTNQNSNISSKIDNKKINDNKPLSITDEIINMFNGTLI